MVAVTATRAAAAADTAKAAGESGSKRRDKAAGPGAVASVEEAKGRQGGGSGNTVSAAETEAVDAAVHNGSKYGWGSSSGSWGRRKQGGKQQRMPDAGDRLAATTTVDATGVWAARTAVAASARCGPDQFLWQ